jgi:hypothetical protein
MYIVTLSVPPVSRGSRRGSVELALLELALLPPFFFAASASSSSFSFFSFSS